MRNHNSNHHSNSFLFDQTQKIANSGNSAANFNIINNGIGSRILINDDRLPPVKNWKREQELDSGSSAIVTLWVNTENNKQIVLKQNCNNFECMSFKKASEFKKRWLQEIEMMMKIECENIVKGIQLPDEFYALKINRPILAMEYCSGGDLRKTLNKPENCCGLSEKEVRQILKQISSAIIYLHDLKIIHRDLKPENIVLKPLERGEILYKLIDLGYAKQLSETTSANSFVGTLEYLAPELFLGIKYTSAVDNWSFGILAFEIITGRRPFLPNHSLVQIIDQLKNKKSKEICTEIDSKGQMYFSEEILAINHISNKLKLDLESWLRIVLEYNPEKRGGRKAFQMIQEIMNKYTIQIFSIDSYETYSFEIEEKTNLENLKEQIFSVTNTIPSNQYLFFEHGATPDSMIGQQIIDTWYTPNSWFERYNPIMMFMFDYSQEQKYQEIYKFLILPPPVEKMLLHNNTINDFDEIKFTWRCSVFIAQKLIARYKLVHDSLKSCILNLIIQYNELQNQNQQLYNTLNQLFASVSVIEKMVKTNYLKRKNSTNIKNGLKSCLDEYYVEIYLKLKILYSYRINIIRYLENCIPMRPKFDKEMFIFEQLFKTTEMDPDLKMKYIEIENAYESIRKMKKDSNNTCSNNLMVKLLCHFFRLFEKLIEKMFNIFPMLSKFIKNIERQRILGIQYKKNIDDWKGNELEELFDKLFNQQEASNESYWLRSPEIIEELYAQLETEQMNFKSQVFEFNKLEFYNFLL